MITKRLTGMLTLFPVLFFTGCFGCNSYSVITPSQIKLNPKPKVKYDVTVTVNGAPGPLEPGNIHVFYEADGDGTRGCYPVDRFIGAPTNKPPDSTADFSLTRAGDNVYKGVIYADYFQDAVYYHGYPACKWNAVFLFATLKGHSATFETTSNNDWSSLNTTYFSKKRFDAPMKDDHIDPDSEGGLFDLPSTDLWTADVKVTPASPEIPAMGHIPEHREKELPGNMDSLQYQKMEDAIHALPKGGAKVLEEYFSDRIRPDISPHLYVHDAVAVVGQPPGTMKAATAPSRNLVIMTNDGSGNPRKAKQNSRIIPGAQCNCLWSYSSDIVRPIGGGFITKTFRDDLMNGNLYGFDVFLEGGDSEHWWSLYTFVYSTDQNDWMLYAAERGIVDTTAGKRKEIDLTFKDFGAIKFEDFDPAKLPQPGARFDGTP